MASFFRSCCHPVGKKLSLGEYGQRAEGAREALLILTAINLLNFADRYVPASVKELIKEDLNLTDAETALPTTGMVVVYMISAVGFGIANDKELTTVNAAVAIDVALIEAAPPQAIRRGRKKVDHLLSHSLYRALMH